MTSTLRESPTRTRIIVEHRSGGTHLVREALAASTRMLGLCYAGLLALLSSAASWEIGASPHNVWIQCALVCGAILTMTRVRHFQLRTLAPVGREAGNPLAV